MGGRGNAGGGKTSLLNSTTDNLDFRSWVKENMSNETFKRFGREYGIEEVHNLWYQKRAQEELKNVHEMPIEEALDQIRETVPASYITKWFREADSDIKPKLIDSIMGSKGTLNAGLNVAYNNYKDDLELKNIRTHKDEKPMSFKKWLNTPQTVYRGEYGQEHVASDIFLSYSADKAIAEKFMGHSGKGTLTTAKIKPIDTWGSYQTTAEQEFLVPVKTHGKKRRLK